MPYVTPQDIPETDDCRSLLIPASSEWLALFGGALTEFIYKYNWEQTTGISVDDTIAKMTEIIEGFYAGCVQCTYPGGYRVIRITVDGHIEELGDNGEWQEPTGDYVIPAPAAREGGTEADQICLAAKNAANVLSLLYENLSESWAGELSVDAAIVAFIGFISTTAVFALVPITWAIVIPLIAFFALVYKALSYLTADLWDEDFNEKLICLLVDCASNDAGVVTFDFECVMNGLYALATTPGFSEVQVRLNLQITYILQFIGGIGALNLAASTTDITNDDCSFCGDNWCYRWDSVAEMVADGWSYTNTSLSQFVSADFTTELTRAEMGWSWNEIDGEGDSAVAFNYNGASHLLLYSPLSGAPASPLVWEGDQSLGSFLAGLNLDNNVAGGTIAIDYLQLEGTGERPNDWSNGHPC
jgi:hypothetical protein